MSSFQESVLFLKHWLDLLHGKSQVVFDVHLQRDQVHRRANADLTNFANHSELAWDCCVAILYMQIEEKYLASSIYESTLQAPSNMNDGNDEDMGNETGTSSNLQTNRPNWNQQKNPTFRVNPRGKNTDISCTEIQVDPIQTETSGLADNPDSKAVANWIFIVFWI